MGFTCTFSISQRHVIDCNITSERGTSLPFKTYLYSNQRLLVILRILFQVIFKPLVLFLYIVRVLRSAPQLRGKALFSDPLNLWLPRPVGRGWYIWMGDHLDKIPRAVLPSGSQAGVVNINHAFHLYCKCCMWIEFQSISTWLRGFSPGTPVSSLLKIDFQSNPSGCGAVLQDHTWTV